MVIIKKQAGVVLIVALVFLVSLTALASALMLNSTSDVKMSGASEQKLIAQQEAVSAVDETIAIQLTSADNLFIKADYPQKVTNITSVSVSNVNITKAISNVLDASCPHQRLATSGLDCNVLQIEVNNAYGKNKTSNVNVNAGVAQQMYPTGN